MLTIDRQRPWPVEFTIYPSALNFAEKKKKKIISPFHFTLCSARAIIYLSQ